MPWRDRLLLKYIKNTEAFRWEITRLFTTTTKPYRKASKDTLSWWVKNILQKAAVNIINFPYSTRSASKSMARSIHFLLDTVLIAEGWRRMMTFWKHFIKFKFANATLQFKMWFGLDSIMLCKYSYEKGASSLHLLLLSLYMCSLNISLDRFLGAWDKSEFKD